MTKEEFAELAAAFALGALNAKERAEFERTLHEHPEWTDVVDTDLSITAAIADAVPEEAPREEVRESLLARLDALVDAGEGPGAMREMPSVMSAAADRDPHLDMPAAATVRSPSDDAASEAGPRRRRSRLRILATLTVVALVIGIGAGVVTSLQSQRPTGEVALEQIAEAPDAQSASTTVDGGGEAALTWSANEGKAVLVTEGLDPAPSGHTYELWYVRGEDKIPAGTFDPDAEGEAAVLVEGEMHEGDVIAVTVEVTGGSPDGTPSDQLVFTIPTV